MTQKSPSVWDYKPWWCQPWSIILTGISLIGGSWLLLNNLWVTVFVAIPVLAWMIYFVLVFPKLAIASYEKDSSN
jgi:hypothetical protein